MAATPEEIEWGGPHPDAEVAARGCITRLTVGSTLHGLVRPGTDDRDELAVAIEPPERVIGLHPFEHWVHRTQPEGKPSGPGDLDLVVYSLRKYCRLALKGSPTVLLLFFAPEEQFLIRSELGDRLRELAPAFVSRRNERTFRGYLESQRRGLLGGRGAARQREASAEHGYDTKYAMHALRVGHQGIELLETGRITLPVAEPLRSRLMEVRYGKVALEDVVREIERIDARLEELAATSGLREEPDVDAVNAFLVESYTGGWRDLWARWSA